MMTATTNSGLQFYVLELPEDPGVGEEYFYQVSSRLAADGAYAAAISCTGVSCEARDEHERLFVLAADCDGGEECWSVRLTRSATGPAELAEWERGEPGGAFMFMLREGVTNFAGLNKPRHEQDEAPRAPRPEPTPASADIKPIYRLYERYIGFICCCGRRLRRLATRNPPSWCRRCRRERARTYSSLRKHRPTAQEHAPGRGITVAVAIGTRRYVWRVLLLHPSRCRTQPSSGRFAEARGHRTQDETVAPRGRLR